MLTVKANSPYHKLQTHEASTLEHEDLAKRSAESSNWLDHKMQIDVKFLIFSCLHGLHVQVLQRHARLSRKIGRRRLAMSNFAGFEAPLEEGT